MNNQPPPPADDDDLSPLDLEGEEILRATLEPQHAGQRIDKVLATLWPHLSRTRLKNLIEEGAVTLNAKAIPAVSYKPAAGDFIELIAPPLIEAIPKPEAIPLDIVFEDDDVLVINKPADMVVHPSIGHASGTLVNALLHHCGDTLSGIGGVKRPGIVHRLDLGTSGLILAAKNDHAHHALQRQLADRSLGRIYHAIVFRPPIPPAGVIDKPIGRNPRNRLKMAIGGAAARNAITKYKTLQTAGNHAALVECRLSTGRTHQIRVHMESIGHPLIGDPLYRPIDTALTSALRHSELDLNSIEKIQNFLRQALHAHEIHFQHPRTGAAMSFTKPAPTDFQTLWSILHSKLHTP